MAQSENERRKRFLGITLCTLGAVIALTIGPVMLFVIAMHPMHGAGAGLTPEQSVEVNAQHRRHLLILGGGAFIGVVCAGFGVTILARLAASRLTGS